jgi:hypothetical protein
MPSVSKVLAGLRVAPLPTPIHVSLPSVSPIETRHVALSRRSRSQANLRGQHRCAPHKAHGGSAEIVSAAGCPFVLTKFGKHRLRRYHFGVVVF